MVLAMGLAYCNVIGSNMVLAMGLLCTVVSLGAPWCLLWAYYVVSLVAPRGRKKIKLYGYVYLWLQLLFGWLKNPCNRRHHAVPLSVADIGGIGGVATHPLEYNFFFSFLFNFNSTVHPTPNPNHNPFLQCQPPPPGAELDPPGLVISQEISLFFIPPSQSLP